MKQLERTDEEPYYPEDDMTDEEYEAYIERIEKIEGEREEYYDRLWRERRER